MRFGRSKQLPRAGQLSRIKTSERPLGFPTHSLTHSRTEQQFPPQIVGSVAISCFLLTSNEQKRTAPPPDPHPHLGPSGANFELLSSC